jgi:DNA-binding NarL/FixJ family response regulator
LNEEKVREALYNYHWQIREIARIEMTLQGTEFKGVAAGGIESVMPSAPYAVSDPIAGEIIRREAKSKRMQRLESDVKYIQSKMHLVEEGKLYTVLECLLDGMPAKDIARHLTVSRQSVYRYIDEICKKLAS